MRVLVIGESCKDIFHYGKCEKLCPDAPVPVFELENTRENWGMAKNVERNLNALGAETHILTNDSSGKIIKKRYMDIRTNHMFLRVDENDHLYGELPESDIDKIDFSQYDAIVVSDYNKGFLTNNILEKISLLHEVTLVDTKRILGPWADNFSYIKLNHKEYENNKPFLTEKLLKKVVITRGIYGSEHCKQMFPVKDVEVKDTSGAGDTFLSGLSYQFVKSGDISKSIRFANECATKVVQKKGVSVV